MGYTLDYYKNIPGLELRSMTNEQLKITLQNIAMHTNQRIHQLKKAGLENISQSGQNLLKNYPSGLSSKGVTNRGDLMKQIKAGQRFLKGSTSTVSGTRSMMRKMLGGNVKPKMTNKELKDEFESIFGADFYEVFRRMLEENKDFYADSTGIMQAIMDVYEKPKKDKSQKEHISDLYAAAKERYEKERYGEDIQFYSDDDLATIYRRKG